MRPLILSHWTAASQRCKCGRWSAEPPTLAEHEVRTHPFAHQIIFAVKKTPFFLDDQEFGMTNSDTVPHSNLRFDRIRCVEGLFFLYSGVKSLQLP